MLAAPKRLTILGLEHRLIWPINERSRALVRRGGEIPSPSACFSEHWGHWRKSVVLIEDGSAALVARSDCMGARGVARRGLLGQRLELDPGAHARRRDEQQLGSVERWRERERRDGRRGRHHVSDGRSTAERGIGWWRRCSVRAHGVDLSVLHLRGRALRLRLRDRGQGLHELRYPAVRSVRRRRELLSWRLSGAHRPGRRHQVPAGPDDLDL
jgi:hypothetical protein